MLEIVQAFLFTSKYILGKGGNYDLYYLFSALVFVWYFVRKPNMIIKIIQCFIPFVIIAVGMILFYDNFSIVKLGVYLVKILFNMTLMIYVIYELPKIDIDRVINYICVILGMETIMALVLRGSRLWRLNDEVNKFVTTRLQLFYIEPSELSFHCGMVALYLCYLIITKKGQINIRNIFCLGVVLLDMLLTAGMGGILALGISVVIMIVYYSLQFVWKHWIRGVYLNVKLLCIYALGAFGIILIGVLSSSFVGRIQAVLSGQDSSFRSRFIEPVSVLGGVLQKTHWLGCGLGNLNSEYGLQATGLYYVFPNSLPYFVAEAGIFAIILIIVFFAALVWQCLKKKDTLSLIMLIYIIVYQVPGGYFTNPINYLMYGLVIARLKMLSAKAKKMNSCTYCAVFAKSWLNRKGYEEI